MTKRASIVIFLSTDRKYQHNILQRLCIMQSNGQVILCVEVGN